METVTTKSIHKGGFIIFACLRICLCLCNYLCAFICLYLSIAHITWSEGGGFIPAMADILWSRPGASAKKEISLSTINQCITIFFKQNNQAVQKYSPLIHFVISDCSQEMLITMPPQLLAMIAMLWLLKIRKMFFALHVVTAGPEHLAVDCLDFPKSSLDPHCPVRILIGRIFCPFQPSPFFEDFCNHVCRKLTVMRKSLFAGGLIEKCSFFFWASQIFLSRPKNPKS